MRNRRRNFTLVELLVVIGIIAILAGMLMAGIMYAPAKAQKAKAQAEITTLLNAIKQYESAYGVLPIPSGAIDANKDGKLKNADDSSNYYKQMILILQADTDNSDYTAALKKLNKRNTKFLDIQGNDSGVFTDPWGNDYNVYVDATYDGKIDLGSGNGIPGLNVSNNVYRYNVVIYSKGNDRKQSNTASDKTNEDNVYSFPTTWSSDTGHNISK